MRLQVLQRVRTRVTEHARARQYAAVLVHTASANIISQINLVSYNTVIAKL